MKKRNTTLLLFAVICTLFLVRPALAGTAHLTWNANGEPDLAGYTIYYDTSSHAGTCPTGYAHSQDAGNVTSFYKDDLTPGQTYYFQLTARDASNNESACSTSPGEVVKSITYRGDINSTPDHRVNLSDLSILAGDFGRTSWCGPTHQSDINRDCSVDSSDLSIMAGEYGQSF